MFPTVDDRPDDLELVRLVLARILHINNGRVTRFAIYWNRERAFADLGLAK